MKRLRCTASSLVVRDLPAGSDTGRRIRSGEIVPAHGESYDRKWAFVVPTGGPGWAASEFLAEIAVGPITPAAFARAAAIPATLAGRWIPHVEESGERFDFLEPPIRLAMWVAQCGHESMSFSRLVENLNYSAEALLRTWPTRFTAASARAMERQPERIANHVYASRMGNGPPESGDGWRYRGRGLIQLTGKQNYKAAGLALGVDLVAQPELLATERYAALSAGWFWASRGLNLLADAADVEAVTKRINGGTHGLADRAARFQRAREALGA